MAEKNETIVNTGNNSNVAGSGNTGIVGNNNTVNNNVTNNYSFVPWSIEESDIDLVEDHFPDKNILVRFMAFGAADGAAQLAKGEIIKLLRNRGYKNINEIFNITVGQDPPTAITIGKNDMGGITFFIPPRSY